MKRYAVGVTKSGGEAKSYTLLDVMSILRGAEDAVKAVGMDDLSDIIKVRNFYDVMGYIGYVSGNEADRRKLYITDMKPLVRRRDGEQFAYSVFTKSIGSGKESRFTLFNREFKKEPVKVGDIIYCKGYQRDGEYFKLTALGNLPGWVMQRGFDVASFSNTYSILNTKKSSAMYFITAYDTQNFKGRTFNRILYLSDLNTVILSEIERCEQPLRFTDGTYGGEELDDFLSGFKIKPAASTVRVI